jgi:4-hydroxybenzoate polyprenyltransferase
MGRIVESATITWRRLRGLHFATHPFPAFCNAFAGAAFFLMADDWNIRPQIVVLFSSIYLIHAAIGSMNDYCDVEVDTRSGRDKPIVRGDITRSAALILCVLSAASGLLFALWLGLSSALVAAIVLLAGAAYNLWAKPTLFSWLPYAIFIPSLPVWGFVAADRFKPFVLLSYPFGVLLSLGLNIANTLPDLEGDRKSNLRGLAHRLPPKGSIALCWLSFALTIVLLGFVPYVFAAKTGILYPSLIAATALLVAMIADFAWFRSQASLRRGWYLAAAAAVLLGCGWVSTI